MYNIIEVFRKDKKLVKVKNGGAPYWEDISKDTFEYDRIEINSCKTIYIFEKEIKWYEVEK